MLGRADEDAVIAVDEVRKAYVDVKAVDGVSFHVAKGEIFGLLGPNGAGKRLNATPLPRWVLVGSNVVVRLVIAAVQTALILGIGVVLLGVRVDGNPLLIGGFVLLGALAFTSIGYVIASFARTEEAANGITSVVQLPLMFLSGIFFPLEILPQWLKTVATFMPLTYLGDALRQTMVGGAPFVPLWVDFAVLAGWLVVTLGISARFFRWQ